MESPANSPTTRLMSSPGNHQALPLGSTAMPASLQSSFALYLCNDSRFIQSFEVRPGIGNEQSGRSARTQAVTRRTDRNHWTRPPAQSGDPDAARQLAVERQRGHRELILAQKNRANGCRDGADPKDPDFLGAPIIRGASSPDEPPRRAIRLRENSYYTRRILDACMPLGPRVASNSTAAPSGRVLNPLL